MEKFEQLDESDLSQNFKGLSQDGKDSNKICSGSNISEIWKSRKSSFIDYSNIKVSYPLHSRQMSSVVDSSLQKTPLQRSMNLVDIANCFLNSPLMAQLASNESSMLECNNFNGFSSKLYGEVLSKQNSNKCSFIQPDPKNRNQHAKARRRSCKRSL